MQSSLNITCKALEMFDFEVDTLENETMNRCDSILQETKVQILQQRIDNESDWQELNASLTKLNKQLDLAEKKVKDLTKTTPYVEINSSGLTDPPTIEKLILKVKECQGLLEIITTNAYHENAIREGRSLLSNATESLSDFVRIWCDSNLTVPGQFLIRESSSFPHNKNYLFYALSLRRANFELAHTLLIKDLKTGNWHNATHKSNVFKFNGFSAEKLSDLLKIIFNNFKTVTPIPLSPLTPEKVQEYISKKYIVLSKKKD